MRTKGRFQDGGWCLNEVVMFVTVGGASRWKCRRARVLTGMSVRVTPSACLANFHKAVTDNELFDFLVLEILKENNNIGFLE
jgi:hypothetical protein